MSDSEAGPVSLREVVDSLLAELAESPLPGAHYAHDVVELRMKKYLAAQPVPSGLDVERLAEAMSGHTWSWLGWTDNAADDEPRRQEAFRFAAKALAREYDRLAATTAPPAEKS